MSRSGYDDDGDQWALIKWRGQVASAIRGKRGQAFLRELAEVLDAMPEQKLIADDLVREGGVCALGAVGAKRGVEMENLDSHDHRGLGGVFGIAHQLVAEIEFLNDDFVYTETPERRWQRMREWVASQLIEWESP